MAQLQLFDFEDPPPARATLAEVRSLHAADYRGAYWRAYTPDSDPEEVRRAFRARYGEDPAEVRRGLGGIVLAGPIPGR